MVRADNRKLRSDLAKTKGMFRKTFGGLKRGFSAALSPVGIGAGAVGFALLGKEVLAFEDTLDRTARQAGMTGQATARMRAQIIELSKASGISRNEVLAAANEIVNLEGAAGLTDAKLKTLVKANEATGSSMKELASLTFGLGNAFGIVENADLEKAFSGVIEAGKRGSVPLNQMALILRGLAPQFAKFSSTGSEGAAELAATLQIAARGFGTAQEAGTGVQALLVALTKNAGKLKKFGVNIFDSKGKERGLKDILTQFDKSKLIKDPTKLQKALGRNEAVKALQVLRKFRPQLDKITDGAKASDALQTDSADRRASQAAKMKIAMNNLKESILKVFTPARLEMFARAMEKVADVAEFLVDNIKLVAVVIGGIKLTGLIGGMAAMATSSGAIAGNMAKTRLGIAAAATAGFALGTALDRAFGLSTKLANLADPNKKSTTKAKIDTGFIRDRANELAQASGLGATRAKFGAAQTISGPKAEALGSSARALQRQASERGIRGPGGRFNRNLALKQLSGLDPTKSAINRKIAESEFGDVVDNMKKALESTEVFAKATKEFQSKGIKFDVTVDSEGILKAVRTDEKARRAPPP